MSPSLHSRVRTIPWCLARACFSWSNKIPSTIVTEVRWLNAYVVGRAGLRSVKYTPKDLDDGDKLEEDEAEGRVFHQKQTGSLQVASTLGELTM